MPGLCGHTGKPQLATQIYQKAAETKVNKQRMQYKEDGPLPCSEKSLLEKTWAKGRGTEREE